jgi:hypothetical protein
MNEFLEKEYVMTWKSEFLEMLCPINRSDSKIQQAYVLKYNNLPEKIYKYRGINDKSKQNLLEGTVWLSDPNSLNDPYDCSHTINFKNRPNDFLSKMPQAIIEKIPKDILTKMQMSDDAEETFIDEMLMLEPNDNAETLKEALQNVLRRRNEDQIKSAVKMMKPAFKLCSFSERNDSILMWAHYSNYHKGFCIEYDIKNLPDADPRSRFLFPVIYTNDLFDMSTHIFRGVDNPEFNPLFANRIGLYKAIDWSYEKEWRLIFSNGIIEKSQAYLMPRPTMVYLGSNIKLEDQEEIVRICEKINVPVKKMVLSTTEYKMVALSLSDADRKNIFDKSK